MTHNDFKYPKESLFYTYPKEQLKKWIYRVYLKEQETSSLFERKSLFERLLKSDFCKQHRGIFENCFDKKSILNTRLQM